MLMYLMLQTAQMVDPPYAWVGATRSTDCSESLQIMSRSEGKELPYVREVALSVSVNPLICLP